MPPEVQSEAQAEDVLLAAVLAPDEQAIDAPKLEENDDLDHEEDGEDETEQKDAKEGAHDDKQQAKGEAEPEEDYVEIEGEEGAEPTRYKLAEVLTGFQEYKRIEGQKAEIIDRVEREATEVATRQLKGVEQVGQQAAYLIQATLQILKEPPRPDRALLDPNSQSYSPEKYWLAMDDYNNAMQARQQATGLANQLAQHAQRAVEQARDQRETAELKKLQRVWPEFGQKDTTDKFVSEMGQAYGFSPEELDAVLTDHRQALVARDALAYRAMKAKSGDVKAKVEAKAPKLVRSKQEAKGSAQQQRDTKGRYAGDALAALKKTNSDEAAVAFFAGLSKAGRI